MRTSRVLCVIVTAIFFHTQLIFAAGTCDLPMFASGRMFQASYGSQFVLTADFNKDGIADLAVLNHGLNQNSISILLGNGDGTFQAPINIPGALNRDPSWAAVADFNGDGNPDLVVYVGLNTSLVMLGNGDGTFKTPSTIAFEAMAVGDFNGDGKPDLVVAATPIGIMLGKGDGTFQAPINSPGAPTNLPSGAVVGDFNGDGKLDVVTANYTGAGVFVLLGDGTGKLSAPTTFGSNKWLAFPNQIGVADLNGDHKLDIVTLDGFGDKISLLLGNGSGTFQAGPSYALGSSVPLSANALIIADLSGDGIPDLAVTHETSNPGTISVLPGNGDGTFQPPVHYNPTAEVNHSLAVGDFNGDGLPDLVFVSSDVSVPPTQVGVMFGTANGTLAAPLIYDTGATSAFGVPQLGPPVLADFNGDGVLDMAVIMNPVEANPLGSGNNLLVSLGNGDGTFQPSAGYPTANGATYMSVGDFNNDGKPDLVVSNGLAGTLVVFLGNGDGTFQAPRGTTIGIPGSLPVVGDFNRDGKLDVVVGGAILLGNGDGTFRASFANVSALATADLNGDGKLDLVDSRCCSGGGVISVQLGNGDGTFQAAVTYPAGAAASTLAIGDLNGDGIPDVAVSDLADSAVAVLLGNGDGSFRTPVHYPAAVGKSANMVAVGDFNGDGFMDLAVASVGTPNTNTADDGSGVVSVLLGNGDGTFRDQLIYGAGGGPTFMTVADVNGDHQPDLVIATGKIWILLNTYAPGSGNSACSPVAPTGN